MRNLEGELKNKKIDYDKLLKYGFIEENEKYIYKAKILDNQFEINIEISDKEKHSKLIDIEDKTEFVLVDVEGVYGEFVGKLRQEYEEKIEDIITKCTSKETKNKCGLTGKDLSSKVYDYLTIIPKGKVVTYKQVAEFLGNKGLARVVGTILHKNPDGDKYPCYKVLNSKGELAEAFVFGGKDIQKERLEREGIKVEEHKVDLKKYQWNGK